jgi:uncharacterized membrane protein YkoI
MFGGLKFAALALAAILAATSAEAQNYGRPNIIVRPNIPKAPKPPLPNLKAKISPSQAAAIALRQLPGAKVVGVKLLPRGAYAVTLKSASKVARVMVDASDGSIM